MELRQLRHFVAVVEQGNLSLAARRVFISQPALTRSIKNLEDLLGTQLLERQPRGVVPTAAGELFYQYARMILNDCQRATEGIKTLKAGISGNVSIGIGAIFAEGVISQVVSLVAEQLPDVNLTVTEGYFEELVQALQMGRLDFLLTNFPIAVHSEELVMEPLLELEIAVVAGPQHPLAKRRNLALEELLDARWVVINQPHSLEGYAQYFASNGVAAPRYALKTNSLPLIRSLVVTGGFLTFLPLMFIERDIRAGRVKPLHVGTPPLSRRAGLMYTGKRFQANAVGRVMQVVRGACAKAGSS
jgi:LysR family transcriptional regulator, regulator of abg operon